MPKLHLAFRHSLLMLLKMCPWVFFENIELIDPFFVTSNTVPIFYNSI